MKRNKLKYPRKNALSFSEKARLAGTIWNHGCIHVEYDKRSNFPRPRIHVTMKNPILYDYGKDAGGWVYPGKDGYYHLDIRKRALAKKAGLTGFWTAL